MDVDRVSDGEKIAAVCAILLFIDMFFSWFGIGGQIGAFASAAGVDTSANAWQSFDFIDLFLLLTIIVACVSAATSGSGTAVNFPLSTAVALLGAISTILVLYRIIDPPSSADRKFGVFIGLILAAGITYGGWRAMEEEGTSFQDAADRFGSRGGAGDRGGPGAGPPAGGPPQSPPPPPPPPPSSGGAPPSSGGAPPSSGV
jgi:hypothetical protein